METKKVTRGLGFRSEIKISNGSLEAMKWIALISMTVDHINSYIFNYYLPYFYEFGRIAMPLFVFVLAYNLARPGQLSAKALKKSSVRMTAFGLLAMIPLLGIGYMQSGILPLNIMFTLLTIVILVHGISRRHYLASAVIFLIAGYAVDYQWIVLLMGVLFWLWISKPSLLRLVLAVTALVSTELVNNNMWALWAMPIIIIAMLYDFKVIRLKWAFYSYYPLHLLVIAIITLFFRFNVQ